MVGFGVPLALLLAGYYALWGPVQGGDSRWTALAGNVLITIVASTVVLAVGRRIIRRWAAADLTWVAEGRAATDAEVATIVRWPWLSVRVILVMQLVISVSSGVGNLIGTRREIESLTIFLGLAITGLAFAALAYLVVERSMRPILALALRGRRPPARGAISARQRFAFAWLAGSGIPLLFILAIPVGQAEGDVLPIEVPMLMMAGIGLVVGAGAIVAAAKSVAEPLDALQLGIDAVDRGDLDTEVAVTDAGEVGRVQGAFNQMVAGLRERRQLQDLFGRYVGPDVARRALDRGVHLGGEQAEAAVLFVDVIGSTPMTERLPASEVVARLNRLFALVGEAVTANAGWINKFEGDGAMAVFGPPAGDDAHAAHALAAARGIVAAVRDLDGIDVGVGVSCGTVVAGNVGLEDRHEYTVIGAPVNEAARLTELAKTLPGRVAASGSVVAAAGDEAARWSSHGAVALRGFTAETEVYRLRP